MSASTKFLLAVFYLAAFLALFAPVALAHGNETHGHNDTKPNSTNTITPPTASVTGIDNNSMGAIHLSSSVALFGALVAAAVFTI